MAYRVHLLIENNSEFELKFKQLHLPSGEIANGNHLPQVIAPGAIQGCCFTDKNSQFGEGTEGFVVYTLNGYDVFFGFVNPHDLSMRKCGISIGHDVNSYKNMSSHSDFPAKVVMPINKENFIIAKIKSTSGTNNYAHYTLNYWKKSDGHITSNPLMKSVKSTFDAIPENGYRHYYKSYNKPTDFKGVIKSHFKGVGKFQNRMIFSHSDLDATSGKVMFGEEVIDSNQSYTDLLQNVGEKEKWKHPGGLQVCGRYMAMGLQASEEGDGVPSKIKIYDLSETPIGQKMKEIGEIERPNIGINGVAMTKEAGKNGKYIIVGIQGKEVTLYRSQSANLLPDGAHGNDHSSKFDTLGTFNIEQSGAGLALVTETNGDIYMFSFDADNEHTYHKMFLYQIDPDKLKDLKYIKKKNMNVGGMSDTITNLQKYTTALAVLLGPVFLITYKALLAEYHGKIEALNTSFRWGKGLNIISDTEVEIYASDRNVFPLSDIPFPIHEVKDFSLVTWKNSPSK